MRMSQDDKHTVRLAYANLREYADILSAAAYDDPEHRDRLYWVWRRYLRWRASAERKARATARATAGATALAAQHGYRPDFV